jgi:hypothetical protein
VAKLLRIDRKLARVGGKLVTDANGAPCCCDASEPLLAAVPCSECCATYDEALPVDARAAPDWRSRPVFYLHGRCWEIVGPWEWEQPPEWLIVRDLFDEMRWPDCAGCVVEDLDCPILAPNCASISPMPNEYELRLHTRGEAPVPGHSTRTIRWNVTAATRITDVTAACRIGCYTEACIHAGAVGGWGAGGGDSFHSDALDPSNASFLTAFAGTIRFYENGTDLGFGWDAAGPEGSSFVGTEVVVCHGQPARPQAAHMVWRGIDTRGGTTPVGFGFSMTRRVVLDDPWFWARGGFDGGEPFVQSFGPDGQTYSNGTLDRTQWTLRPLVYCCPGAPPPGRRPISLDGGSGQSGGPPNPPLTDPRVSSYMANDPMRKCKGCGDG